MKMVLVCLMVVAMCVPVLAEQKATYNMSPAFDVAPNTYIVTLKNKRGPFGGGFLGTDNFIGLVQVNPTTGQVNTIGSANGNFDFTPVVAGAVEGGLFGGLGIVAANQIKNSVKSVTNVGTEVNNSLNASSASSAKAAAAAAALNVDFGKKFGR